MVRLVFVSATALLMACPASATPCDAMKPFFGNTLHITSSDGTSALFYANDDGRYSISFNDGLSAKGLWTVEGDKWCTTRTEPAGTGGKSCHPFKAQKPGDSWEETNKQGVVTRFELKQGR